MSTRCSTGCFSLKRCTQRANRAAARVLGSFLLRREVGIPGIRTQSRQLTLARSAREHTGREFGHDEAPRPLQKAAQTCATARFRSWHRSAYDCAEFHQKNRRIHAILANALLSHDNTWRVTALALSKWHADLCYSTISQAGSISSEISKI